MKLRTILSVIIVTGSITVCMCSSRLQRLRLQEPAAPEEQPEEPAAPAEQEEPPASTEDPIQIAILAPLSGPVPTFGVSTRDGAIMAIEEWNARGGVLGRQIEYIVEDSQCTPDPAVNAANKVIEQDGVKYIIGEVCSSASIPITEITEERGILQISPTSTNVDVTLKGDGSTKEYVFRACFIDPFQGLVMAQFALDQGHDTAFILFDQGNDYVLGLAENFEENFVAGGGTIVGKESYTAQDTDFSASLTKVADVNPDVLYVPDYYNILNLVGAQAKERGITAVLMGGDGWDSGDLDRAAVDGGYYSNHYSEMIPARLYRIGSPTTRLDLARFLTPWRPWLTTPPTCCSPLSKAPAWMILLW
jgi:branched-chain amino acid transport system substrate-binding protein